MAGRAFGPFAVHLATWNVDCATNFDAETRMYVGVQKANLAKNPHLSSKLD